MPSLVPQHVERGLADSNDSPASNFRQEQLAPRVLERNAEFAGALNCGDAFGDIPIRTHPSQGLALLIADDACSMAINPEAGSVSAPDGRCCFGVGGAPSNCTSLG